MSFTAPKFTGVGRQLQTRVIAGDTLTFTAIKLGDGTMTTEPIAALTDLIHGIITLPVHEVRRNADYAEVTGVFQNAGLSSGFYWREIGIFAADPDYPNDRSHDILYCYQNAAELAEYIPSASSAVIEKIIRVACVVGDAESVTVGLASQAYAKAEDLQALEEQHSKDVERINDALDAADPTKITTKAAPADGDGVMIADSADGGKAKRLLWSNVKAALGKLFVPLARKINGKALSADVTLTGDDIAMGADDAESLRAAMAKRDVEYGVIEPENLQEWASAQTAGGTFMLTPNVAKGVPDIRYWRGILTVGAPGIDRGLLLFTGSEMYRTTTSGGKWDGPWRAVADCVAPETHSLLMADGWAQSNCFYFKSQENIVHVTISTYTTQSFVNKAEIATLPEGFRPVFGIEVPAVFKTSHRSVTILVDRDGKIAVETSNYWGTSFDASDYFFATFSFVAG